MCVELAESMLLWASTLVRKALSQIGLLHIPAPKSGGPVDCSHVFDMRSRDKSCKVDYESDWSVRSHIPGGIFPVTGLLTHYMIFLSDIRV